MENFVKAARVADVPKGGARHLFIEGRGIVLCELEGEYFALDAMCPHKGGPLGACPPENGSLFCPMHGWEFDIRTGACKTRPDRPATCYPVRVVGEEIEVSIP